MLKFIHLLVSYLPNFKNILSNSLNFDKITTIEHKEKLKDYQHKISNYKNLAPL